MGRLLTVSSVGEPARRTNADLAVFADDPNLKLIWCSSGNGAAFCAVKLFGSMKRADILVQPEQAIETGTVEKYDLRCPQSMVIYVFF